MSLPEKTLAEPIQIDAEKSQEIRVVRIPDPGDGGPAVAIRVVWEVPNPQGAMVRVYREVDRSLIISKWHDPADTRTFRDWVHAIINTTS